MSRYAVVIVLPEEIAGRMDVSSREFDTIDDIVGALRDLDAAVPHWRMVSFCHAEDLPLLLDGFNRATVSPEADTGEGEPDGT